MIWLGDTRWRESKLVVQTPECVRTYRNWHLVPSIYSDHFIISFTSFKFSRGRTAKIRLVQQNPRIICPVRNLKTYLQHRGLAPGCLFCEPDTSPLVSSKFYTVLNSCTAIVNPGGRIQGHSFRIDAASWAASLGLSDARIRRLGRWSSNTFIHYIR